jgi:catechol 2,3-dioxygenase-like lactoylglutathione lyase family enzyme
MSTGMRSWPLGAVGAAMLIVAIALLTTASMRGADKAFVSGTVHVVLVSEPPQSAEYGRCEMQVLVDAPGHPGQTVVIRDPRVPVSKWPDVGETLPALVSVSDARRVKIQWDRVGTHGQLYEDINGFDHYYNEQTDQPVESEFLSGAGDDPAGDDTYVGYHDDEPIDLDQVPVSSPDPTDPLPRRPSPHRRQEPAGVAVLEGELLVAEVPAPRAPTDTEQDDPALAVDVNMIDFSDLPEPDLPISDTATGPADPRASTPVAAPLDNLIATSPEARPAVAGSIHGVGITMLVTDLPRSLTFYRDMLGFYEIDGGPGNVVLASGDTKVVLRSAQDVAPVNRRLVHLNLEVSDVDAVYSELKVRGARFTYAPRVVNRGERLELWAAAFRDPDGHGIAITQWKARTA